MLVRISAQSPYFSVFNHAASGVPLFDPLRWLHSVSSYRSPHYLTSPVSVVCSFCCYNNRCCGRVGPAVCAVQSFPWLWSRRTVKPAHICLLICQITPQKTVPANIFPKLPFSPLVLRTLVFLILAILMTHLVLGFAFPDQL